MRLRLQKIRNLIEVACMAITKRKIVSTKYRLIQKQAAKNFRRDQLR
jgi:hypothetical protein